MLQKEDVLKVAAVIKFQPTDNEIQSILKEYPSWEADRPIDNWTEIIEDMLYQTIDMRLYK
jgi:hypothetical protein